MIGYDGRFQSLSDGWSEVLGRPCDNLVGTALLELVHRDDVARTEAGLALGRQLGEVRRFENRLVASDGSSRWLVWSALEEPEQQRFHAVARNITPQREAEERRRESQRLYEDLIESSHDIVQSIDPSGHFEFVNRSWHEHLGYAPDELPALTLFDIVEEAHHEHCSLLIAQIMQGMSFENVEVTFVAKDGHSFPVEGNATGRFRDGEFVGTHTFFRDVSERKQAEAMAAEYQQQLEQEVAERSAALVQSEKLATLGRLSAGMAHELNNPAAAAGRAAARPARPRLRTCGTSSAMLADGAMDRTRAQDARPTPRTSSPSKARDAPDTLDPAADLGATEERARPTGSTTT